ncbi:hypothetical protein PG990_010330 [Apiospora arundinis]
MARTPAHPLLLQGNGEQQRLGGRDYSQSPEQPDGAFRMGPMNDNVLWLASFVAFGAEMQGIQLPAELLPD